jgi:hypothetical protein
MVTGDIQIKMQVPGFRSPPTKGCRPRGRPEVFPAHTCNINILCVHTSVKKIYGKS